MRVTQYSKFKLITFGINTNSLDYFIFSTIAVHPNYCAYFFKIMCILQVMAYGIVKSLQDVLQISILPILSLLNKCWWTTIQIVVFFPRVQQFSDYRDFSLVVSYTSTHDREKKVLFLIFGWIEVLVAELLFSPLSSLTFQRHIGSPCWSQSRRRCRCTSLPSGSPPSHWPWLCNRSFSWLIFGWMTYPGLDWFRIKRILSDLQEFQLESS